MDGELKVTRAVIGLQLERECGVDALGRVLWLELQPRLVLVDGLGDILDEAALDRQVEVGRRHIIRQRAQPRRPQYNRARRRTGQRHELVERRLLPLGICHVIVQLARALGGCACALEHREGLPRHQPRHQGPGMVRVWRLRVCP
jgi:hypothetical protein